MFKWFDNWFAKKCKEAWDNSNAIETGSEDYVSAGRQIGLARAKVNRVRESSDFGSEPITFRMFKANGGWAIEFRYYNDATDRSENSLYVVNNEEELGNHISKIITMEALKR
jgi:hypothetical protein